MNFERQHLLATLRASLSGNDFWAAKLAPDKVAAFTLHLAIFREPYLKFIIEGKKTIETRFAKRPCAPFEKVNDGDVIMLKRSPGDVIAVCVVETAWFYHLDSDSLQFIKAKFGRAICPADPSFWEDRKNASVATLILIDKVAEIKAFKVEKRDRRGWVVFPNEDQKQLI